MSNIIKNVEIFYKSINSVPNHRYKSWEHCYNFFNSIKNKRINKEELDLAQLHLAFYLASWGMYRGSSFILQKDYTIFKKIVEIILSEKYFQLWDLEQNIDNKELFLLFEELYLQIEKELIQIKKSVKNHPDLDKGEKRYLNNEKISYTLITKIILGTIGCIPAYDRFFIAGTKTVEGMQSEFNPKKSLAQLITFYKRNKEDLEFLLRKFKGYPPMKILDMYFWVTGYNSLSKRKD